ncbi:oligogalacturonate lyase family protein [Pseudobythopirellula maris]|nr:oligogalacturonate lyase family protein [Pseudobythopirellula maris]
MRFPLLLIALIAAAPLVSLTSLARAADEPPLEWTDPDTGYRIHRLTTREGENRSFYFHNNPFVPAVDGGDDLMVFYGAEPEDGDEDDGNKGGPARQLFVMNLRTRNVRQLTDEPGGVRGEIVAAEARTAYCQAGRRVLAVNVDSGESRLVVELPEDLPGSIRSVNADNSLIVAVYADGIKEIYEKHPKKSSYFGVIYEAKLPNTMFTIDTTSGEIKVIHEDNAWLNHQQFSPTDPNKLSFCHEGHWHMVQRIWNMDISTGEVQPIHERTVHREIAGHEFWSRDGKTIWFDLQIPRGETFYLTGYDLATGKETRYEHERHEWSVHYNISPDQTIFVGDGGSEGSVAGSPDGHWIYLFEPDGDRLKSTRLANLKDHDYGLEPNAHFTPDQQRIIFRSNMHGPTHVYAIDLER